MEQTTKDNIFTFIVVTIVFGVPLLFAVNNYKLRQQLNATRTELTEATEELQRAADTNTELRSRLGRVSETVGELEELSSDNLGTINDCIELIRDIREKVKELEDGLLHRDTDSLNNGCSDKPTNIV